MFAERYLERRFQEGVAVGEEKALAKGMKVGEKRVQKRWEAWNRRRVEAEARNEPFNEPPPSLDVEGED